MLQGSNEQDKNKYRTEQVDELGVLVRAKGLVLSSYVAKGADKYEDMNLALIFGKTSVLVKVIGMVCLVVASVL